MEFVHKLVGYSGAALLFSGVSEACRAVRGGRHDFINTAISGAVTGGVVVGHYQGPRYRLLGVVTWGGLAAALHATNQLLRPRHILEDYLIREGLLSPEVARRRVGPRSLWAEADDAYRAMEARAQQDVLVESLAIRDRELKFINTPRPAAAAVSADGGRQQQQLPPQAPPAEAGGGGGGGWAAELPDDDPGYVAWLRIAGLDSEVLLQQQQQQREEQEQGKKGQQRLQQEQEQAAAAASPAVVAGPATAWRPVDAAAAAAAVATGAAAVAAGGLEGRAAPAAPEGSKQRRTWAEWLASPWRRRPAETSKERQ
ncbi:hypothetical protein CHLRE_01g054950v5 [Chlamydomonas reinhardtii]|uniref:Uncharacterized protein n=1 Tax=Chlamydomonas reinhardtii TaxID=3055 RepID=A0A2K3E8B1_CHLRE|nr:uncharacterized protein CHLRE_01g054950v5 [Chlamydomonas reinhardtii]PNW89018.1 hypothetical protein CHLRE_01g054950v5 [Chlamydomonas reinhardtii]